MKCRNKILLYVLSLLMISLISFNTSFISAETSKTIINFVDEDGLPIDIEDTVTIVKLEDQGGTKVPVSVYIKDGKETTDYDKGTSLNELEVKNGKLEIEGLTKDNDYLISFDNDYVFQKEVDEEINYYLFGSFKGGSESYIFSTNLKSVDELTLEQLEEIAGNKEITELALGNLKITLNCNRGGTFTVSSYNSTCWSGTAGSSSGGCTANGWVCSSGREDFIVTYKGAQISGTWCPDHSETYTCKSFGLEPYDCSPGTSGGTLTCESAKSATQYYNANGGTCTEPSSSTRTKDATTQTKSCNSSGKWVYSSCTSTNWTGSVQSPSCSKSGKEYATVSYNGNKGSGSTNVTLSKNSDSISRAIHYNFNGFSNYSESFTSDTTAYAQYSERGRDAWPSVTLPTASRTGYTFKNWTADGNTYSAGQTVYPNGGKTYTANWEANSYEYTIVFKSSTGKILDTRKETHKFDETITISHDAIPGYEVNDRQVNWNVAENGHTVEITYQIITYNIEYSLELGNRYPSGNPTVNPNASVTTYNVENNTITFASPTRTGYTFIGWYSEENFINEKPTIPAGSVGNVKVYAKFEANSYPLTVTNTNDRVSVTGTINGESYTLAPKQSITKQIVFDTDFTVTSDTTNPVYYTSDIRNHTVKDSYRSENITSKSLTTSMGGSESNNLSYSMEVGATRNVKTFTVELKNDNGHSVENTVKVDIYDNLTGALISETSDELINTGTIKNTVSKTDTVNKNNTKTITYTIPENTHLVVSATNNSIQTVGYDNSSTGKTADYLTLVETPDMYSSDTKDIERKSYSDEIGTDYIIFTTFDNALDAYKGDTYPLMVVDNKYNLEIIAFFEKKIFLFWCRNFTYFS